MPLLLKEECTSALVGSTMGHATCTPIPVTVSTGSSTDGQGSSVMDRISRTRRRLVAVDPLLARRGQRTPRALGRAGPRALGGHPRDELGPGTRRSCSSTPTSSTSRVSRIVVAVASGGTWTWLELRGWRGRQRRVAVIVLGSTSDPEALHVAVRAGGHARGVLAQPGVPAPPPHRGPGSGCRGSGVEAASDSR